MSRLAMILALVAGCGDAPKATAELALEADTLGPLDTVHVTVEPGDDQIVRAPLPASVFVPIDPGRATRLTVVASFGGVERWWGVAEVAALGPGEQVSVELPVDAVGRLEARISAAAPSDELWVERSGARRALEAQGGAHVTVAPVGRWALRLGRVGQTPVTLDEVEIEQGVVTTWAGGL